jgi:hypothetical protein
MQMYGELKVYVHLQLLDIRRQFQKMERAVSQDSLWLWDGESS